MNPQPRRPPIPLNGPSALAVVSAPMLAFAVALCTFATLAAPPIARAQAIEVARVEAPPAAPRIVTLPGELQAYQAVDIHARVQGYVETVLVDRGSIVKKGETLATLVAPELNAQVAEAASKADAAEAQRAEAEARLAAARATFERLKQAAATPGAVAGLELLQAEKAVDAAAAAVQSHARAVEAAKKSQDALKVLAGYLRITAPFSGVITSRGVHPGALVGPAKTEPLLRIEQTSRLRLIVPVPERGIASVARGRKTDFTVPAYPNRVFSGTVTRLGGSLDLNTRAMPVELDVDNATGQLQPGMYPEVRWPIAPPATAVLVPPTAVVTTTERTFVIRVAQGKAQWVNVKKGATNGTAVEVIGPLTVGDTIVRRATDEIRDGATVQIAGR